MGVGQPGSYLLRLFGAHVTEAFGYTPYQVGSSLPSNPKRPFRDVDVRLMLPDEEFETIFGAPVPSGLRQGKLQVWNLAWSVFGQRFTGLPIDFQFQHTTAANEEFDGVRSALVLLDTEIVVARTG